MMKMKSFTKQIVVLAMALLVSVQVSAYDFEVGGLYYNVVSIQDMTAEVTNGDNRYSGDVVIPETVVYKGRTLSVIGMEKSAFSGSSITSVVIPNSVTSIEKGAFQSCSSLASVVIPNSVTIIGEYAFNGCSSLASVVIPNSVTSIEGSTFQYCRSLVSMVIPNSVTSIKDFAFNGCSSLASVVIPNSVTTIGWCAFQSCSSLASVVIPNSVTSIGENAFNGCSSLTSVVIPNSVANIGNEAFASCSNLNTFTLGSGVSTIESIFCSIPIYGGPPSMVSPVSKLHISDSPNALVLKYFTNECFELYFLPLKELYVGRTLQIDRSNSANFAYSVINQGIEKIEYGGSLKSDDFYKDISGNSLRNRYSFDDLQTVIYGDSIEYIENPHESVSEIYLRCPTPPQSEEWSNDNYLNTIVYVPKGTLPAYQSADVWKNFWEIREWDSTTGVETPTKANGYSVTASGRQITVRTDGQRVRVRVYNAAGRLLYDGGEGTVTVNAPGLYIVRAGDHTEKLLIK